ncbi:hypothetical protein KQI88_14815 [Alkaliphilus sp. MSJ-5]|uniref:SPOR domain-containing protein n=1 Tax=Alkaliphilus flagellatus TaxID=2841507 RepID=A0ABS6G5D2_9FIRM|nr:hypothetical protein [Alkaliphilus flagellatus]MBU5677690.1 hypothetical protein [Alkaliphilus flagellatus]
MRKSRIGIRRRQRRINIGVAIFFLVILPITAVAIGSRITEWLVIPTINTDNILKPPSGITLEGSGDVEDGSIEKEVNNVKDVTEVSGKEEINTEITNQNSLSAYMIQIASISDNKNIESLIEQLNSYSFPHIIYKLDNIYKVYTFGSTKREDIEKKLDNVREVYADAYIGQIYIPQKQIHYSSTENNGTKEVIDNMNSLIEILNQSSETLYKFINAEGTLEEYKKILINHQKLLAQMSEKINNVKLPKEFANVEDIKKMIEYQEKNILESLKVIEEGRDTYQLQNHFLDSLFRTIEVIKK